MVEINDWLLCHQCGSNQLSLENTHICCHDCGAQLEKTGNWINLNAPDEVIDEPMEMGQVVSDPDASTLEYIKKGYLKIIVNSGIPENDLRILELGAGLGHIAFGFSRFCHPKLYLATDTHKSFCGLLRRNLDSWNCNSPTWEVGALNGNKKSHIQSRSFNVIIGHSVLHHILDYEECLEQFSSLLDCPGIMIFVDPLKDGWIYYLSLVNFLLFLDKTGSDSIHLCETSKLVLRQIIENLNTRMLQSYNRKVLSTLEDKHIFSVHRLQRLAEKLKMEFSFKRTHLPLKPMIIDQLRAIGLREEEIQQIIPVLNSVIPVMINESDGLQLIAYHCYKKNK